MKGMSDFKVAFVKDTMFLFIDMMVTVGPSSTRGSDVEWCECELKMFLDGGNGSRAIRAQNWLWWTYPGFFDAYEPIWKSLKDAKESDARAQLSTLWCIRAPFSPIEVDVKDLKFTHDEISPHFRRGERFDTLIDRLRQDHRYALSEEKLILDVVQYHGGLFSLSNRRLYCFQCAAVCALPHCCVRSAPLLCALCPVAVCAPVRLKPS